MPEKNKTSQQFSAAVDCCSLDFARSCEEKKIRQFPEVMMADITHKTNREKRPLFTLVGKDSDGKAFTIIRAWLPNECEWSCRWMFQILIPDLAGQKTATG